MKTKAFILIILAGIFWGTSVIFVNITAPYGYTSIQMTAIRSIVSALSMAIYILILNRKLFKIKLSELILFIANGASFVATATCYYASMQLTSAPTAVMLMYTAPAIVMVYSVLFLGERFTKLKALSLVLVLVGCAFVSGLIGGFKFNIIGILIGALSGISYSAYNIITKISLKKGSNPISTTFYTFLFGAMVAICISSPGKILSITFEMPGKLIPLLIAFGICTCIAPYFLYTLAMKDLSAGTASALGIIEPVAATIFSIAFFHQKPDIFSIGGIVLVLAAVVLLGICENSEKKLPKV
jgi:drug/metabolite transporter (DMT)-like permease